MAYLLAIDQGTSSPRSIVFALDGQVVAGRLISVPRETPRHSARVNDRAGCHLLA